MQNVLLKLLNIEYKLPQDQDSYTLEWGTVPFTGYQLNIQAIEPGKAPLSLPVPVTGTHERFALSRAVYLASLYSGSSLLSSLCFRVDNGVIIVIEDDNGYEDKYKSKKIDCHNFKGTELSTIKTESKNGCINIDIPDTMQSNSNIVHYLVAYKVLLTNVYKWSIQRLPKEGQKRIGLKLYSQDDPNSTDIHAAYKVGDIKELHLLGMDSSWNIPDGLRIEPRTSSTPSNLGNDPTQTSV